ncbi:MAG TPA: lipopolysaccharide kinase InaA family protein, partial [Methylomirabilota bacterium]|nr:lipopolysaccharide kinase InaA family protein [Methylomirabilota bacterium]
RLHSRSRRCLRRNSEFAPRRFGSLKWHLRLASLDAELERILRDPDAALARAERVFKGPGHTATVAQIGRWVLKRANLRSLGSVLKDLFRPSRALLAFRKAHHLELLGIASPLPVAAAERRWLRFLRHAYLVTEAVEGAQNLGEVLARSPRAPACVRRQLATLVARLHDEGFSHRDLKETNLLVDTKERVFLIDLDGLAWRFRITERRAAADLARLARAASRYAAVTRADRIAFLKRYCRARGLTRVPRLPA